MEQPRQRADYDYDLCALDNVAEDLRILEIINDNHDPVQCRLHHMRREHPIPYIALSWCWGPRSDDRKEIIIRHQIPGTPGTNDRASDTAYSFWIAPNLEHALKRLRHHGRLWLWIDAVCMNQEDITEKNNQVPLMSTIYGNAKSVYIWLGEEEEKDKKAFAFITNQVLQLTRFDQLVLEKNSASEWQAMFALMTRPWFSRRWVIQEVALAKEAMLMCGPDMMKWLDFADAVSLFSEVETATRSFSAIMRTREEFGNRPDFFGHVPALSATRLVEVTNDLFRRRDDNEKEALLNLEHLVSSFTAFEASEARDTVYALLAIAKDTLPHTDSIGAAPAVEAALRNILVRVRQMFERQIARQSYHVDYQQPVSDVYKQFVQFSITKSQPSRALDIICRPWAPAPKSEGVPQTNEELRRPIFSGEQSPRMGGVKDSIPSWIPTLEGAAFGMNETRTKMNRINADPLVDMPPNQTNYRAAGNRNVTKALRFEEGITKHSKRSRLDNTYYHSLVVEGFVLDTIAKMSDEPSQHGNIPKCWDILGESSGRDSKTSEISEEYWRTLVADRGPKGVNALRYYPRMINHGRSHGSKNDALNMHDAIHNGDCKIVGDVLRRVQAVIWNKSLMRTTEHKALGLVPKQAKEGDLICILYGCNVPVILRQFEKSKKEFKSETRQWRKKWLKDNKHLVEKLKTILKKKIDDRKAAERKSKKRKMNEESHPERHESKRRKLDDTTAYTETKPKMNEGTIKKCVVRDLKVYYELIGECYVHGMMNGEAIGWHSRGDEIERRRRELEAAKAGHSLSKKQKAKVQKLEAELEHCIQQTRSSLFELR
jgi:hypothetical protein